MFNINQIMSPSLSVGLQLFVIFLHLIECEVTLNCLYILLREHGWYYSFCKLCDNTVQLNL